MKLHSKIISVLLALILAFSMLGAVTVSAVASTLDEEEYQYTQEEVEMYASLLGISYEEALASLGLTEADIVEGGTAVSDSSIAYSYTDMLTSLDFTTRTVSDHGITYKLPTESTIYSPESDEMEFYEYLGSTKKEIMNSYGVVELSEYTDPLTQAVVYYQITAEENTPYGKYIGNYNELTVAEQESLIQLKVSEGYDESNTYTVRKGGNIYLVARTDADYMSDSGLCTTEADITTIINGTVYNAYIYIQHGGTESDAKMVDNLISTFNVKGIVTAETVNYTLSIIALCICGVLLIVIGFLVFFIIRFSIFSKASGSKFNIIGFSMPKKITATAVSKHNFRANSGIVDSLENDDVD